MQNNQSEIKNIRTHQPIHSPNTGWECPKCHRIYSPSTKTCERCNPITHNNMESNRTYAGTEIILQQLNEG